MNRNLIQGKILPAMLVFSIPFILSALLQTLYGLMDLFIIGQFEPVSATTAISNGSQIMHMVTTILIGLVMGTSVLVGRSIGSKREEDLIKIFNNSILVVLTFALILTIFLLCFSAQVVNWVITPAESVEQTRQYLFICVIGIPFIAAYNVISAYYRGAGDSKMPMIFIAAAAAINIVLDYILIGPFHMGVAGAAIATTSAQAGSVLISYIALMRQHPELKSWLRKFSPLSFWIKDLIRLGLPVSLQEGFIQISFLAIMVFANMRGVVDAAAVGVVEKVIGILFLIPSSMLQSVSVMCSQNIGAGYFNRVNQVLYTALGIVTLWGLAIIVIIQFTSAFWVGLFVHDPAAISAGEGYLRAYSFDCLFAGIHFCFNGYMYAFGYSLWAFIENSLSIILARLPLSYYASITFMDTLYPMGWATSAGSLVSILCCLLIFFWIQKKLKNPGFKQTLQQA